MVISDVLHRAVWRRKVAVDVVNREKFNFENIKKSIKREVTFFTPKLKLRPPNNSNYYSGKNPSKDKIFPTQPPWTKSNPNSVV